MNFYCLTIVQLLLVRFILNIDYNAVYYHFIEKILKILSVQVYFPQVAFFVHQQSELAKENNKL